MLYKSDYVSEEERKDIEKAYSSKKQKRKLQNTIPVKGNDRRSQN
jgi:hypothetical protein